TYCVNTVPTRCAVSASATFNVSGPTGTNGFMSTTTSSVAVSGPPVVGFGVYGTTGSPIIAGIDFFMGAMSPAGNVGTFQWVQLINTDQILQVVGTGTQTRRPNTRTPSGQDPEGTPELDNFYPYPILANLNTRDSPAVGLVSEGEKQRTFSATMYLMWDPTLNLDGTACTAASTNVQYQQTS